MKKILYNRLTKLLVMLLALVFGGITLFQLVCFARDSVKYEAKVDAIYTDYDFAYWNVEEEMRTYTGMIMDEMINAWCSGGRAAVEYCVQQHMKEDGSQRFYMVIADENEIYSNWSQVSVDNVEKQYYVQYVNNILNLEYIEHASASDFSRLWLRSNDANLLKWYDRQWDVSPIHYYLSSETIAAWNERNHGIVAKLYLTEEYVNSLYDAIGEKAGESLEVHRAEFIEASAVYLTDIAIFGSVFLALCILSILLCGRTVTGLKELNRYEKSGTELHIGLIAAVFVGMFALTIGLFELRRAYYDYFCGFKYDNPKDYISYIFGLGVAGIIIIYYEVGILVKKLLNRRFVKDMLIVRGLKAIKKRIKTFHKEYALTYSSMTKEKRPELKSMYTDKVILDGIMLVFLLMLLFFAVGIEGSIDLTLFLCVALCAAVYLYFFGSLKEYKNLKKYNDVVAAVDIISKGDYRGVGLMDNDENQTLEKLANLSASFEESVCKQVESERMQIDLVANVSHDLKKPLASIISYVDLLKEENMSDVAKDYVQVLVDKSARLKDIVSDVFDLAKATNGERIVREPLDGVELINLVLSDMNDQIEESGKELRVKMQTESAPIRGNSQKLYRVFQNVIDNALKYSMPETRIFLNVELCNDEFVITLKNVSEFEMDFTEEEIMSRFTRGDKSRHSEGTGLGLSIAKSFTELCGGTFDVKIDDDIFMVIIRLR